MSEKKLPTKIPKKFHWLFWDTNAAMFNPSKQPLYAINRLLDKGDEHAVGWVLQNFPEEMIKETLRKIRDFRFDTATFWANYLDMPIKEVKCMQEPYKSMRKLHWSH